MTFLLVMSGKVREIVQAEHNLKTILYVIRVISD